MNITIVNQHKADKIGGSEIQCDLIAEELTRRGHSVTYVAARGGSGVYHTSYDVVPCSSSKHDLLRAILASSPGLVYWRYNKNHFLYVVRKLKREHIPVIFAASSVNDVNPGFYKKNTGIRKTLRELTSSYLNHLGFRYVDAVTVNNSEYLHQLPVSVQEFIPNGLPDEVEEFSWDNPYCVWIGSIKQIKRPELMVELAGELESSGVDFLMAGEIQETQYNWLQEPGRLPSNLYYLGLKSPGEVNGMLKNGLLHIHTCYSEGFPNVFIQAWGQGIPSVSYGFDPGGYIEQHQLGVCANEDKTKFTAAVRNLLHDSDRRSEIGQHARTFAKNMFSTDRAVTKLEELIQKIIMKHR